jgi:hypothetical protein
VTHRLDNETRKAYELQLKPQIYPKWAELLTFLKFRCHILESIENSRPAINKPASFQQATPSSSQNSKPTHKSSSSTKTNALLSSAKFDFNCWVCEKPHYITQCKEFLSMSSENQQTTMRKLNLCFNCLCTKHSVAECKSGICRTCLQKHHKLLHSSTTNTELTKGTQVHKT